MLDAGLPGAQAKLSAKTLIESSTLFTELKGALTENYVAQELLTSLGMDLYYWTSSGTAEINFILQLENQILPLEAKAGISSKKKSLISYSQKINIITTNIMPLIGTPTLIK